MIGDQQCRAPPGKFSSSIPVQNVLMRRKSYYNPQKQWAIGQSEWYSMKNSILSSQIQKPGSTSVEKDILEALHYNRALLCSATNATLHEWICSNFRKSTPVSIKLHLQLYMVAHWPYPQRKLAQKSTKRVKFIFRRSGVFILRRYSYFVMFAPLTSKKSRYDTYRGFVKLAEKNVAY